MNTNASYESLSQETKDYMLGLFSESGYDTCEGFLKACVVDYLNA